MSALQRVRPFALLAVALGVVGTCLSPTWAPAESVARKNTRFPQHILIIRHAEKTGDKADVHLSGPGKHRAEILDQLFARSMDRPDPFPTPDFIFAARAHKDSQRPVETVTLLARKLKLNINDRYDNKLPAAASLKRDSEKVEKKEGMAELRDELFGSPRYIGKTILVAWRHGTIAKLAQTLKARNVPEKWEDAVFDRVWQISYDDDGKATFRDRPQRLLPGDAEK